VIRITNEKIVSNKESLSDKEKQNNVLNVAFYEDDLEDRTRRYYGDKNLTKIKESTILCVGAGALQKDYQR